MTQIIEQALQYAKEIFEHEYSGHDFFHTKRVFELASKIAERERADLFIVQLAAILHDVDDRKISPETTKNLSRAVQFMTKQEVCGKVKEQVCEIIRENSFKGTDSSVPASLEGKCVQDADRLDAMGAIGIARAFAYGGNHNRVLYNPEVKPVLNMNEKEYITQESTTINHFYEKLLLLKDMMNTQTGKRMADKRHYFMELYLREFYQEWDCMDLELR